MTNNNPYIIHQNPGDYNYSNNQNYLMAKMSNIDIYWSWFFLIVLSVCFIIGLIVFILLLRRLKSRIKIKEYEENEFKKIEFLYSQGLTDEQKKVFNTLMQLIVSYEDVKQFMGISDVQAEQLYFNDMRRFYHYLSDVEKDIYQYQDKYRIQKYDTYKKKLMDEVKSND